MNGEQRRTTTETGIHARRLVVARRDLSSHLTPLPCRVSQGCSASRHVVLLWTVQGAVTLEESSAEVQRRALVFMASLFDHVPERTVAVVTHKGMVANLLVLLGQSDYSPSNAELVPMLIEDCRTA